ncbi:MAG TPA: hypothetical protein V6C72_11745, partial [Chroococcales cyanobacterium]
DDLAVNATRTGEIFGTPQYMSPEQALGKRCDARTDQYSLGCLLFEMLAGRPLYTNDSSVALMMSHISDPVPSFSKVMAQPVPARIEKAILKLLSKDPEQRFADMEEASQAIFGAERAPAINRNHVIFACLAVIAIAGALATIFFFSGNIRTDTAVQLPATVASTPLSADDLELAQNVRQDPLVSEVNLKHARVTDAGLAALASLKNLQRLDLTDCLHLTDEGMRVLADTKLPLKNLTLTNTMIGDAGLQYLSSISTLKELTLNTTKVTEAGAKFLPRLSNCEVLELNGLEISPRTLQFVGEMPAIDRLELNDDHVEGGIKYLPKTKLSSLSLSNTRLSPADFKDLSAMESLKYLFLGATDARDKDVQALAQLPRLRYLELNNCRGVTVKSLSYFSASKSIRELHFDDDTVGGGVKELEDSPVVHLSLNYVKLTREDLEALARMKQLEKLFLRGTDVTDSDLKRLVELPRIREIKVSGCPNLSSSLIVKLQSEHPKLELVDADKKKSLPDSDPI